MIKIKSALWKLWLKNCVQKEKWKINNNFPGKFSHSEGALQNSIKNNFLKKLKKVPVTEILFSFFLLFLSEKWKGMHFTGGLSINDAFQIYTDFMDAPHNYYFLNFIMKIVLYFIFSL